MLTRMGRSSSDIYDLSGPHNHLIRVPSPLSSGVRVCRLVALHASQRLLAGFDDHACMHCHRRPGSHQYQWIDRCHQQHQHQVLDGQPARRVALALLRVAKRWISHVRAPLMATACSRACMRLVAAGRCWKVAFASLTRRMHAMHVLVHAVGTCVHACKHDAVSRGYG